MPKRLRGGGVRLEGKVLNFVLDTLSKCGHFLTSTFSQLKLLSLMVTSGLLFTGFSGQFLVICHLSALLNMLTAPSFMVSVTILTPW